MDNLNTRLASDDLTEYCTSCGTWTDWICERDDKPLCDHCECVWLQQIPGEYKHVSKGAGTPYLRYYMSLWPRHLPPPKSKRRAKAAVEIIPFVEHMLDAVCANLAVAWDREDALLAIAEIAVRVHARDARVIDAWNEFVERERDKRTYRRMMGWRNNYYNRLIDPDQRPWRITGDDDRPRKYR
jgi:hypothetical protein